MRVIEAPNEDIDARLDALEQAFPDVMSAGLLRAMFLVKRGELDEAIQIVHDAATVPITDWSDLEIFVNIADTLSVEDSELAVIADELLQRYLSDPQMGSVAARVKLARGFRWGRLDEIDQCLDVIELSLADVSDATLGWASLTEVVRAMRHSGGSRSATLRR